MSGPPISGLEECRAAVQPLALNGFKFPSLHDLALPMQPVDGARFCSQEHEEDIERLVLLRGPPKRHTQAPTITHVAQMGLHCTRVETCFHGRNGFDGVVTLGPRLTDGGKRILGI